MMTVIKKYQRKVGVLNEIALWVNQNFLVEKDVTFVSDMDITFQSLRTKDMFSICMSTNGQITIYCDDMGLVGELTQSLAVFLNLSELQVRADFPDAQERLVGLLQKLSERQEVRVQLGANMAESAGTIRSLVVRAEDARLIGDIPSMKKWYNQLSAYNSDLLREYKIRSQNHEDVMDNLKQINQYIQKASKLRVGEAQSKVTTLCRTAVKNSNTNSLIRIIKTGEP